MSEFGTIVILTSWIRSIWLIERRFSFSRYEAIDTGTTANTCAVLSFNASSSIRRRTDSARDSLSRTTPVPEQRGQM